MSRPAPVPPETDAVRPMAPPSTARSTECWGPDPVRSVPESVRNPPRGRGDPNGRPVLLDQPARRTGGEPRRRPSPGRWCRRERRRRRSGTAATCPPSAARRRRAGRRPRTPAGRAPPARSAVSTSTGGQALAHWSTHVGVPSASLVNPYSVRPSASTSTSPRRSSRPTRRRGVRRRRRRRGLRRRGRWSSAPAGAAAAPRHGTGSAWRRGSSRTTRRPSPGR